MSEKNEQIFRRAVALRIRGLCAEKQMTISALAAAAGVSSTTIYGILNSAQKNVRVATIIKLCNGLEVSPKEFFRTEIMNALEQEAMEEDLAAGIKAFALFIIAPTARFCKRGLSSQKINIPPDSSAIMVLSEGTLTLRQQLSPYETAIRTTALVLGGRSF